MTHVLIATDGSGQSLKAARYTRSLLDPAGLHQVTVVAVVRPLAAVPFATDFGEAERTDPDELAIGHSFRKAAQEAADRIAKEFRGSSAEVVTQIRAGTPADQIIRAADELDVDLIVVGGRGKGAVQAILLGSVAYRVMQHATCPVLVTR